MTARKTATKTEAPAEDTTPLEGQTTVDQQVSDAGTPPIGNVNTSAGPVEQADPQLVDREPLGGIPLAPSTESTGEVLITLHNNGTESETELEDGSVIEYFGSFARYVPKGGTPVTVHVGSDVQSVRLKGVEV